MKAVDLKMVKLLCENGGSARELRRKLGLNQTEFWGRVGVTQSGGCRYEASRQMPIQVAWALHLTYGTEAQVADLVKWFRRIGG